MKVDELLLEEKLIKVKDFEDVITDFWKGQGQTEEEAKDLYMALEKVIKRHLRVHSNDKLERFPITKLAAITDYYHLTPSRDGANLRSSSSGFYLYPLTFKNNWDKLNSVAK